MESSGMMSLASSDPRSSVRTRSFKWAGQWIVIMDFWLKVWALSWKSNYENVPSLSRTHKRQFIFTQGWEREWSGCHCSHHNWQLLRNIRSPNLFMNLFKRGENKSSLTTMTETYEVYFPVWGVVFSIRLSHGPLTRNFPSKGSFQYRPPPCHRENRKIQTDLWIYINENTSLLCYIKSCFPAFSSTFSECRLSAQ